MRYVLTGFLAVLGLIAVLGAVASASGLPSAFAEFEREPEDLYLLIFWAVICLTVGAYCIARAAR
jgi:hypothetical protein